MKIHGVPLVPIRRAVLTLAASAALLFGVAAVPAAAATVPHPPGTSRGLPHLACNPESPDYGYNRNSAGQDPPPWAFSVWPPGGTCGDWTNIKVKFCATSDPNACTGYEYGPHITAINKDSRVNGPLADSLGRAYVQFGGSGIATCHRRVFPSVASSWTC
jgi:hypothetical protein